MRTLIFTIVLLFSGYTTSAQNIYNISYENIPGWTSYPVGCFFNQPPPPAQVGGFSHYAVAGGCRYVGNGLQMDALTTGSGTAYGIYFPFKINHTYNVEITLQCFNSVSNSQVIVTTNSALTQTASSCSPGYVMTITSGANFQKTTDINTGSLTTIIPINNYIPNTTGINYLLIAHKLYNGLGSSGSIIIKNVKITETVPVCNLTAPVGLTTQASSILTWNSLSGSPYYDIEVTNTTGGTTTVNTYTSNTNSYNLCASTGANISYRVRGVCSNTGTGPYSAPFSFTYGANVTAPTNLSATSTWLGSYYGYYINFTPVPGVASYSMEWFDVTNNTLMTTYTNIYTPGQLYYYFTGGRIYRFRLAANMACGVGPYSTWSADLYPPAPDCNTGIPGSSLSQSPGCGTGGSSCSYTNLSWPAVSGVSQYKVQYNIVRPSTGQSLPQGTITGTSNFTSVYYSSLSGTGWVIYYRVAMYCNGTYGNYGSWSSNFVLQ